MKFYDNRNHITIPYLYTRYEKENIDKLIFEIHSHDERYKYKSDYEFIFEDVHKKYLEAKNPDLSETNIFGENTSFVINRTLLTIDDDRKKTVRVILSLYNDISEFGIEFHPYSVNNMYDLMHDLYNIKNMYGITVSINPDDIGSSYANEVLRVNAMIQRDQLEMLVFEKDNEKRLKEKKIKIKKVDVTDKYMQVIISEE